VALSAAAGVGRYLPGVGATAAFVLAALALAAQASLVSLATEQFSRRMGSAVTGLLQATLANLPEFFVVLFALQAHQRIVAETAILGSILCNALLVLGLVLVAGSLRSPDRVMRFAVRLPNDAATLLLVASFIIVLVGLADSAHDPASHHTATISIVGAVAILLAYGSWLWQHLFGGLPPGRRIAPAVGVAGKPPPEADVPGALAAPPPADPAPAPRPPLPLAMSAALLVGAGVGAALVSDWFVHALTPTIASAHISRTFAGLVIVAIAGNAVENVAGIVLAARGQAEVAIAVVKSSVAQIAAFLYPLLVLVSLATATTLTFALAPVQIGALLGTAVLIWQITGDGEGTAFEGAALVAVFVILATVAWFER
jgi:Ca2+:H+ antiporter